MQHYVNSYLTLILTHKELAETLKSVQFNNTDGK